MIDLIPDVFMTQIHYRESGSDTIALGFIGEFKGGVAKRYKKDDPDYMYKDFVHSFHCSKDGKKWSHQWDTHGGAIRRLLEWNGKDPKWGGYYIIPTPQTFIKQWR